jgi:hypothetical protein
VIVKLVEWHDINLCCAGAVVGIEDCTFGGVKLILTVVGGYINIFTLHIGRYVKMLPSLVHRHAFSHSPDLVC